MNFYDDIHVIIEESYNQLLNLFQLCEKKNNDTLFLVEYYCMFLDVDDGFLILLKDDDTDVWL